MSTELSRNRTVPLWGFIVIIGVGSVIIIGSVFFGLRYYIIHHDSDTDSIRNDPETVRRVTVRRGRIVPQSHYMSLTGSRFGVGAFGDDARSGARSKSPFEWWNNVHSRSNSQMSQVKGSARQTPEPTLTGDTPRKHAPSPLRSAASFDSMSEKPPAYSFPTRPALAHRPSRTTNFSRPALGMASPSVAGLPEIAEASPHQSMISSRQSKQSLFSEKAPSVVHSELGAPRSPASMTGFGSRTTSHADVSTIVEEPPFDHHRAVIRQRSQTRIPRPAQTNPSRSRSLPRSPRPADNGFEQTVPPSKKPAVQSEKNTPTVQPERNTSNVQPERKPPTAHPQRTSSNQTSSTQPDRRPSLPQSLRRSSSTLNSRNSYRAPGDADHITGQLSNASVQALPQMNTTDHTQAYWESRQDLQPVRRKSQKGKVLRKKSLQRAERTSMVN